MKAIQFSEFGGPEVLEYVDVAKPTLKPDQVIIQVKAIGVNYADTMRRNGQYVVPTPLPFIPGSEVAGVVLEKGSNVSGVDKGDRVVSLVGSKGYAEYVAADANSLIPIPDNVDDQHAVALPLQGLSAYHILRSMGRLESGETVLVHAAAGGVGSLSVQLAKIFGADKVIATASTPEKLDLAKKLGADELVNYSKEGWEQEVLNLTDGKGVDVALEMVGGKIFDKTLTCLAPFGRLVIFGAASGEQPTLNPVSLLEKNHSVVGFFLPQMMSKPELFQTSLEELLNFTAQGKLQLTIGKTYPLEKAAQLHSDLQSRKTVGKLILVP